MSELPDQTGVLVVGAGPVGLAVAASLAGHGHDFVVVDRQAAGATTSRAAVVHARTLEMLERDRRLEATGVFLGIQASQFSIRDGDRGSRAGPVRSASDGVSVHADGPAEHHRAGPPRPPRGFGGRVHRPYVATGVTQTADGAEVTLDSGDTIKAQYVVAADGMNSTIRDLAGLGHDGDDALSLSLALADVRWEGGPAGKPGPAVFLQARHVGRGAAPGRVSPARGPKSTMPRSSRMSPMRRNCSTPAGCVARR